MRLCELKQKKSLIPAPADAWAVPLMWNLTVRPARSQRWWFPDRGRLSAFFGRESEYVIPLEMYLPDWG